MRVLAFFLLVQSGLSFDGCCGSSSNNLTSVQKTIATIHGKSAPLRECHEKLHLPNWTVCLDDLYEADGSCLVYSFGIANEWMFDVNMALLGCEVHMFDPTVILPSDFMQGAPFFFHHWGLYGGRLNESRAANFSSPEYGHVEGEMKTLLEMQALLGHENRSISIFKIDCEGCEWEVFGNMDPTRRPMERVNQLLAEFHFSNTLGIKDASRLDLVGRAYDVLWPAAPGLTRLEQFYHHANQGRGHDRHVIGELVAAGVPIYCCNEQGFTRAPCSENGRVSSAATQDRRARNVALAKAKFAASAEGLLLGGMPHDKEIFFVGNGTRHSFPSLQCFASYGYDFESTVIGKLLAVRLIDSGPDCCHKGAFSSGASACFNCTMALGMTSPLSSFLHRKIVPVASAPTYTRAL